MPPQDASSRSGDDPDDSLIGDNDQEEPTQEMVATNATEWTAAMEGYSPLTDLGGQAMFVAFPTSENDDSHQGEGGVFFADLSAFHPAQGDEESGSGDGVGAEDSPSQQSRGSSLGGDFRALADDALSSLEREYAMTIRAGERSREMEDTPIEVNGGDNAHDDNDDRGDTSSEIVEDTVTLPDAPQVERELPPIDADAVLRAVESIRLRAPDLTTNLDKGSEKQKRKELVPKKHDVIPATPLAAFRRLTPKAIRATANLSRSATIAEALCRIGCFASSPETLVIHVVGADPVECDSDDRVRVLFGPLVRWIGAMKDSPSRILFQLIGPNLPVSASSRVVDLMPTSAATGRLQSATASFYVGVYDDWMARENNGKEVQSWLQPDIAVAFNAGIWGYNEWRPTLEALNAASWATPFVITSYTREEADEDANTVEDVLKNSFPLEEKHGEIDRRRLWKPEDNPFGSQVKRETSTAVAGRIYRENAAWQAWQLGGLGTSS